MATGMSHLGFSFSVVAVVAHVLGVVLSISVWTLEDLSSLSGASFLEINLIFIGIKGVSSDLNIFGTAGVVPEHALQKLSGNTTGL